METRSRAKFNAKRRDSAQIEPHKSQRLASPSPPPPSQVESVFTTKITDLNDDCLINIFGLLDLRSLFNVAMANKYLQSAARDVYQRKFGEKLLSLRGWGIVQTNALEKTHEIDTNKSFTTADSEYCIQIYGLKLALRYLRCFGPSIAKLDIVYDSLQSKRFDYLHQYINDYCADTLSWIAFESMPNIDIKQFQKVFVNIERLWFDGELGRQWPTFIKCFPNLRNLYFEHVVIVDRCPEQPFEHLHTLILHLCRCIGFTLHQFVADLLSGIQQLERFVVLSIADDEPRIPIGTLLDVINLNPLIEELACEFEKRELIPVNATEVQRIITDYPELIELHLVDYQFSANDAMLIARLLDWLQKFKFQMLKSEYEIMKTQLNDEWTAVDDDKEYDVAFDDNHACVTLRRCE